MGGYAIVLGFSSDYVIRGSTHGTSAYVRPVAARRVGSRLLKLAESFGRARGATAVQIEASLGAFEFYKRHGFMGTTRRNVALPSGFRMPCVFMRKEMLFLKQIDTAHEPPPLLHPSMPSTTPRMGERRSDGNCPHARRNRRGRDEEGANRFRATYYAAKAAEQAGDAAKARRYYGEVVRICAGADADARPELRDARQKAGS